ncbi:MAG TPA: hypothetical protein VI306_11870 [Pyrinomonadaceae bacterium]
MRFHRAKALAITIFLLGSSWSAFPQERRSPEEPRGSLAEVRDQRRALLLVFKLGILDASNEDRSIIDQVLKADPVPKGRNQWVYGQLAKKLNSYIRKYKSLTPAQELSDADYVIYFNLIEYRRILNSLYPYGEIFVIVKGSSETQKPPRVIWRGRKILWAGDAIGDFIKELRNVRGES